jgi:hypothetical protein
MMTGRGRNAGCLRAHGIPFLESQRPIVDRRGQAETELGKGGLAVEVAAEHAADLRNGDVAFIDEHQCIVGQIFEERGRRLAGAAAGQITRIVFDAGAGAGGHHHLDIEERALFEPLRFEDTAGAIELIEAQAQLFANAAHGLLECRLGCHVMRIGVDLDALQLGSFVAGQGIEFGDLLDLIAKEAETPGAVFEMRGKELNGVAAHAE